MSVFCACVRDTAAIIAHGFCLRLRNCGDGAHSELGSAPARMPRGLNRHDMRFHQNARGGSGRRDSGSLLYASSPVVVFADGALERGRRSAALPQAKPHSAFHSLRCPWSPWTAWPASTSASTTCAALSDARDGAAKRGRGRECGAGARHVAGLSPFRRSAIRIRTSGAPCRKQARTVHMLITYMELCVIMVQRLG